MRIVSALIVGLGLVVAGLRADDGPPANWPRYLKDYRLPAGRTWSQYRVRAQDHMPQALVPAGEFSMGAPVDERDALDNEKPAKVVQVSAFWIDLHPVTVAQYRRFLEVTRRPRLWLPAFSQPDHPMVMINWDNVVAYVDWVGARLPTEAQYEKAARGGTTTRFPWGDQWSAEQANGAKERGRTTAIGTYPANGYGLLDMVGNIWEWCQDYYADRWYAAMPSVDPCNTQPGPKRVLRGGSWCGDRRFQRVYYRGRLEPGGRIDCLGFRCVEAP